MPRTCSRCDCSIERPHHENANYVISDDFCECETQEVTYGLKHTTETLERVHEIADHLPSKGVQEIAAEVAQPNAPDTIEVPDGTTVVEDERGAVETATFKEIDYSIPKDQFEEIQLDSANAVQQRDDIAYTFTKTEECDVQKTGLVCRDCCDPDNDQIIWGADK